jgi:hypothetical protein
MKAPVTPYSHFAVGLAVFPSFIISLVEVNQAILAWSFYWYAWFVGYETRLDLPRKTVGVYNIGQSQ